MMYVFLCLLMFFLITNAFPGTRQIPGFRQPYHRQPGQARHEEAPRRRLQAPVRGQPERFRSECEIAIFKKSHRRLTTIRLPGDQQEAHRSNRRRARGRGGAPQAQERLGHVLQQRRREGLPDRR